MSPYRALSFICWLIPITGTILTASLPAFATEAPTRLTEQPPRIRVLLEQAWALESGTEGQNRDLEYAAALYCEAARHGSAEGHYRSGLIHLQPTSDIYNKSLARTFLSIALQLGYPQAELALSSIDGLAATPFVSPRCLNENYVYVPRPRHSFDLEAYIATQPASRREIAKLISSLAPEYGVDPLLALAIASVESNFEAKAVSPKQAMGIMQLMPATAARFKVANPFDPEQNIRGGLSYLKWLDKLFAGKIEMVVAAYNAGEGAVQKYGAPPPYAETQNYLIRVLDMLEKRHDHLNTAAKHN